MIDYTHETGDLVSQGLGFQYRSLSKIRKGVYSVHLADLSQECLDSADQAYKCQKWNGNATYTGKELKAMGFSFKKPDLFIL